MAAKWSRSRCDGDKPLCRCVGTNFGNVQESGCKRKPMEQMQIGSTRRTWSMVDTESCQRRQAAFEFRCPDVVCNGRSFTPRVRAVSSLTWGQPTNRLSQYFGGWSEWMYTCFEGFPLAYSSLESRASCCTSMIVIHGSRVAASFFARLQSRLVITQPHGGLRNNVEWG